MVPYSEKPNLKPFRGYDEHEVINGQYAHVDGTVNKGTMVSILTSHNFGSPFATGSGTAVAPVTIDGNLAGTPSYATSPHFVLANKVNSPASGTPVLGMLLNDVRPYDFANSYSYENFKYHQMIPSGRGVKIVTKGEFNTNNWTGTTPAANLGGYAHSGVIVTTTLALAKASPSYCGRWMTTPDSENYAIFKLEC